MPDQRRTRRTFVGGTIAIAAGMAGCSGGGTASGEGGSGEDTGNETAGSDGSSENSVPSEVEEYLADTGNYDGVVDETGASEPRPSGFPRGRRSSGSGTDSGVATTLSKRTAPSSRSW